MNLSTGPGCMFSVAFLSWPMGIGQNMPLQSSSTSILRSDTIIAIWTQYMMIFNHFVYYRGMFSCLSTFNRNFFVLGMMSTESSSLNFTHLASGASELGDTSPETYSQRYSNKT